MVWHTCAPQSAYCSSPLKSREQILLRLLANRAPTVVVVVEEAIRVYMYYAPPMSLFIANVLARKIGLYTSRISRPFDIALRIRWKVFRMA